MTIRMDIVQVELRETPGRIAVAESAEVFKVSADGVTGPVYNASFSHKITKFAESVNGCCDRARNIPGHLHMSPIPSVIAATPGVPAVRIACRIGDTFTVDRIRYRLVNQRNADPILVPLAD